MIFSPITVYLKTYTQIACSEYIWKMATPLQESDWRFPKRFTTQASHVLSVPLAW
jgi:hypothetical protein